MRIAPEPFPLKFMPELDIELAVFVTEDGLYQMRSILFGLTNAPAIMQRLINCVLAPQEIRDSNCLLIKKPECLFI